MRLVFFLLAIANIYLVWRHYDELLLIGSPAEAEEVVSAVAPVLSALPLANVDFNEHEQAPLAEPVAGEPELPTSGAPLPSASSITANDSVPRQCYWAGPFSVDELSGQALMKRLGELRIGVSDHRSRTQKVDRFWVIIPSVSLPGQAGDAIAKLKQANIDSYEIGRGEHAGAISLGFYSREALAQARLQEAQDLGWQPELVPIAVSKHQQWLQVDKQQADAVGEGILARMVKNNSGVEIIEKKCELPVASHNNIH